MGVFQSTLPTRGSDDTFGGYTSRQITISIHAPHEGERLLVKQDVQDWVLGISIHAPHEGERLALDLETTGLDPISIHAPHEGERPVGRAIDAYITSFQSTLPTRGSDMERGGWKTDTTIFQSTLPTRGSDSLFNRSNAQRTKFQSTLPTRGSDAAGGAGLTPQKINFNPRSPRGGATIELQWEGEKQ